MMPYRADRFFGWFSIVCTVACGCGLVGLVWSIWAGQVAYFVPAVMAALGFGALGMVSSRIYWLIRQRSMESE